MFAGKDIPHRPQTENSALIPSVGRPLDSTTRAAMEGSFGHDFSEVRIHDSREAARSAAAYHTRAYTYGRHVVFGQDQFAPHTSEGRRLLAHELTHVVQQRGRPPVPGPNAQIDPGGKTPETQAEQAARRMVAGQTAGPIDKLGHTAVQREEPKKKQSDSEAIFEAVYEGATTLAKEAYDNNPKLKRLVLDPWEKRVKRHFGRQFGSLGRGDKWLLGGQGALMFGSVMATEEGRAFFAGKNLWPPFKLFTDFPVTHFSYEFGKEGEAVKRASDELFKVKFGASLKHLFKRYGLDDISGEANIELGYDQYKGMKVVGANLTVTKGAFSVSAGNFPDIMPDITFDATQAGRTIQSRKRVPAFPYREKTPDRRIFVSIDVMKLNESSEQDKIKRLPRYNE